jgi:ATP-binding protein involved in chromosome partitioning
VSASDLEARVTAALGKVVNARSGSDIVAAGMVKRVSAGDDGKVAITFALGRDDPATLVREARLAAQAVPGVTGVRMEVAGGGGGGGDVQPQRQTTPKPVPPPTARELPNLGKVIAVSSGKGGVGKSTVAVNVAAALAAAGRRMGLMDADIYGPNIPRMFGIGDERPAVVGGRIQPIQAHGVKVMSLGNLVERDAAAIWRGPIIMKIIQQFLGDVEWGQLDYLLVDMPPGTGDAQLSLVQSVQVSGAIIVTTPQEVAVGDALRGAKMFEKVGVPVLGIVENMSYFSCPHCGERTDIFSTGGGSRLATELGIPLLAQIPLQARVQELCESGVPVVLAEPDTPAARALTALATEMEQQAASRAVRLPIVAS